MIFYTNFFLEEPPSWMLIQFYIAIIGEQGYYHTCHLLSCYLLTDWEGFYYVADSGSSKTHNPLASFTGVVGLQACTTRPSYFSLSLLKILCTYFFLCVLSVYLYVCIPFMCSAHRGQERISDSLEPWNWSHRWLLATIWMHETEPGSSAKNSKCSTKPALQTCSLLFWNKVSL